MHWNVPLDALPGSAMFVRVLDCWLMDCASICMIVEVRYYISVGGGVCGQYCGLGLLSVCPYKSKRCL